MVFVVKRPAVQGSGCTVHATAGRSIFSGDISKPAVPVEVRVLRFTEVSESEKSAEIARDIWAERREAIRENIHTIGSRMTAYASQLPEDQLLAKADKVKIATEIAGKIVGLDRQEDKNVVNIALLGSYTDSASTLQSIQVDTIEGDYSVGHTDSEPL
jgi:hypothetical protein